ncbi:uncharacterized protein K452DRAFT_242024, partial [Aplosporella prunicola CBS 121167]
MLPDFLASSYQQYKNDTNAIASWLATTAKDCGYSGLAEMAPEGGAGSGRPKGKARKKKKKPTSGPAGSSPYTISIKDFTDLAEYIVGTEHPAARTVPPNIIDVLSRTICIRKSFADQLSPNLSSNFRDTESEKRHSHFVDVLQRVKSILSPHMSSSEESTSASTDKFTNAFSGLHIEEPSESFLQAPDMPPSPKTEPEYSAETPQDTGEAYMALYLLLQDYSKLRTIISKAWAGYKTGRYDLVAASITTNTALDFAQRLEAEVKDQFEKHGGIDRMLQVFYLVQCEQHGQDSQFRERRKDDMNFKMYDAADTILFSTYLFLNAFLDVIGSGYIPVYKPGHYGIYHPSSDRNEKSSRQKFQEDKIILMELLPEFALVCMNTNTIPAQDELTRGLRVLFKTRKMSFAVVFAAQIFLDIHYMLRDDVVRGFKDLQQTAQLIQGSLNQNFKFHASLRIENWPPSNDQGLHDILARINDWVTTDPFTKESQRLRRPNTEPFKLMKNHPLFCGLYSFSLKSLFQEAGVVFASSWGSIIYSAHIYNAVWQEKLIKKQWKDMELVYMLQGQDEMFGGTPKNTDAYLKRFCLSMGYSATAFAQNRRPTNLQPSKKGSRGLTEQASVAQMFRERYCHGSGRTDFTQEELAKIIANTKWDMDYDVSDDGEVLGHGSDQIFGLTRDAKPKSAAEKRALQKALQKLTPTELLEALCNTLQGERIELAFDYFRMHRMCWMLLRCIKDACAEKLRRLYGPEYIENETQLPFVMGYIFMAAARDKNIWEKFLKSAEPAVVTSELLELAA